MKKLLYICEHLSTGGMPAYVLKQIETFKDQFHVCVCEVKFYGDAYVVHRNKIKDTVVCFKDLHGNQKELLTVIERYKPDIIHFQEVPESFIGPDVLREIYKGKYFIVVTSHSSLTRRKDFKYLPDRLVAVNKWQKKLFEQEFPEISVDMWEYPIENKVPTWQEKDSARIKLGMTYARNVLNVGLFTPGKNQGELFEVARKDPGNYYHFVGNQAVNFKDYWEPLMKNKPENCIVWGEREDTDLFYKACDDFYFTSKFELCPLVIKEALSYGLRTIMYKLPTYLDDYDNNERVTYL